MVVYLLDGLGNQMFQYAFALGLKRKYNLSAPIRFNLYRLNQKNSIRRYGLGAFSIENESVLSGLRAKFTDARYYLRRSIVRKKYPEIGYTDFCHRANIYEGLYHDDVMIYDFFDFPKPRGNEIYIKGWFQNQHYFENVREELQSSFRVSIPPSEDSKKELDGILQSDSVAVHIRRGDYLNPQWSYLNLCDYEYYRAAMEKVADAVRDPVFYIFSNTKEDVLWIKENYDFSKYRVRYMAYDNPAYEDFRLMYSCRHFIISNSTFSWWAQYMGSCPDKIVVAPSMWHKEHPGAKDALYMDHWMLIDVGDTAER